ncbi:hypothetical protein PVL29_024871 [Vitis rotundifolia]|uniref:Putative plant transposon protein domain-containing protein n=1 Tax=Vitis rotundifolia TaxID=103349 RepID=A0AA38YT26_VITRO|nr:hypothetical protein PVL29_024871 [Vitis rotundifolia]
MPPKKKVRHGSTSTAPEEVPQDPFMPRHPPDEHECDRLIAKRPIAVERVILIAGFEEHGVAELLEFYKLRPFIQLTQECYPTPVRAFYSNIRNVDEAKYSFDTSFKGVVVRVSPSLIGRTFSLETPKKAINFFIPEIDIKGMSDIITKELCGHAFQLGTSVERTSLLPKYRILSLILFHTVLNKKGHLNELTLYVLHILFHMARRHKINLPALICHNMIEARRSNVSTRALPYGSTVCLLLQNAGLDFNTLPYESMPRMQPMSMKHSMDKQTAASSSHRPTKSSQLGDIYAMCKSMNNQLKLVRQQCDRSIAAWKTLHPDALPPTPSQTDDEEDGDDDGEDEEEEDAPIDEEE